MSDHLPSEIVEEILQRLPVKSLVKFASVCRAWNSIITDQTFVSNHLNRTIEASNGNRSLFFQFSVRQHIGQIFLPAEDSYSSYVVGQQPNHSSFERFPLSQLFQQDRYTLFAGACYGLVCSADYSPSDSATIIIWNPLLRKYVVLPKPITTCKKRDRDHFVKYQVCIGFGFDSKNNDYKVVRLMNLPSEQYTPYVEVYSLVSLCWRSITVKTPQFLLDPDERNWLSPVFVNGAVHWVVGRRCNGSVRKFILSFDVTEETFGELMLPQKLSESIVLSLLAVEGGRSLGVAKYCREDNERNFTVWMMKEYGITESWTKIVICSSYIGRPGSFDGILALTDSGKVIMSFTDGDIALFDASTGSLEPVGLKLFSNNAYARSYLIFYQKAGSYVESLFFVNKKPHILSF